MLETVWICIAVSVPSFFAPSLIVIFIGWRETAAVNSSERVNSHFTGRPVFERRQHAQVLGQQFLLAAEPASDEFGKDVDLVRIHLEQVGKLDLGEVRGLGAGADVDAIVGGAPGDRAVGFHVRVLDLRQRERAFIDGVRLGKSPGDVAGLGFDFLEDVVRVKSSIRESTSLPP